MGLDAETVGFKKGLFFSFSIEALDIGRSGRRLVSAEGLSARLDLPSLLLLRASVPFSGRVAGGELRGRAEAARGGYSVSLDITGAELGETGLLPLAGTSGGGSLSGTVELRGGEGEIRFSASSLKLDPATVQDARVPLDMFDSMKGMARVRAGEVELESVSFEGKGMYAKLQGRARGGLFEGKLELMPDLEVVPDEFLASAMGRYRVSRGHYSIPLKEEIEF
jgi:type II secretion system protein N